MIDHVLANEPQQEDFIAFVTEHFDPTYYQEAYSDTADSDLDPLQHWLTSGFMEERQISRHVVIRRGNAARRSSSRIWRHYRWRGHDIAARLIGPLPSEVMNQIVSQARHDPAVLAAGADTIARLSQQDRENVHLDVARLHDALPGRVELLLVVPDLGTSRAQKLAADTIVAASEEGQRSIQTIVADRESPDGPDPSAVAVPWQLTNVVYWPDFWIHGSENINMGQLAQLISVLSARVTIVAGSRRGHEMLARYGRALSARTKLYCVCTAAADSDGAEAGFYPETLAFATALTDDMVLADRLRERHGNDPGFRIAALPRHSAAAFRDGVTGLFGRP